MEGSITRWEAEEHWQKYLPNMYARLVKEGTLEQKLDNAVSQYLDCQQR